MAILLQILTQADLIHHNNPLLSLQLTWQLVCLQSFLALLNHLKILSLLDPLIFTMNSISFSSPPKLYVLLLTSLSFTFPLLLKTNYMLL